MAKGDGDLIVGLWTLVAYEDRDREDMPWTSTFGIDPRGLVLYHSSGLLWVQVLAGKEAPWEPYLGYVGTWAIREVSMTADGARGVVEHRIESATLPELLKDDPARPFSVSASELTLGDDRTYRRHFRRVDGEMVATA
jgi:hypothetical protein